MKNQYEEIPEHIEPAMRPITRTAKKLKLASEILCAAQEYHRDVILDRIENGDGNPAYEVDELERANDALVAAHALYNSLVHKRVDLTQSVGQAIEDAERREAERSCQRHAS